MKILIAIINWNTSAETIACIKSLLKYTKKYPYKIVVLDNNSTQHEYNKLKKINNHKITLVRNHINNGYAGGNNQIARDFFIKDAGFSHVLFLNNDTVVTNDFCARLLDNPKNEKAILGPIIKDFGKETIQSCGGQIIPFIFTARYFDTSLGDNNLDFVSGCCLLVPRKIIDKIGLLDERFFCYVEDLDYCLRAKRAGFTIRVEEKAILYHKGAASSKQTEGMAYYYINRNRFMLAQNNSSKLTFIGFLIFMPIYILIKSLYLVVFDRQSLKSFISGSVAGFRLIL